MTQRNNHTDNKASASFTAQCRSWRVAGCGAVMAMVVGLGLTQLVHAAEGRATQAASTKAIGEGSAWLNRVQNAAQRLNYSGNFVYQQGSLLQSSRITHAYDASGEHEKLEILDGQAMEYIRHNDELKCYIPETKVIVVEKRPPGERFPGLLMTTGAEIDAHYKITPLGSERVAGRNCQVTMVEPRDKMRYGYRLWTDQQTGLLLKAQTLNERGEVIEQVGFTQVTIGQPIDRASFRPRARSLEGWRTEKLETRPVDLAAAGWSVKNAPPGFQKIREVKRLFSDGRQASQMVFSDGLANMSVFIENTPAAGTSEGETNRGAINVMSKRHGDFWLTVVGEAPANSIRQLANSLEFNKSTPR